MSEIVLPASSKGCSFELVFGNLQTGFRRSIASSFQSGLWVKLISVIEGDEFEGQAEFDLEIHKNHSTLVPIEIIWSTRSWNAASLHGTSLACCFFHVPRDVSCRPIP